MIDFSTFPTRSQTVTSAKDCIFLLSTTANFFLVCEPDTNLFQPEIRIQEKHSIENQYSPTKHLSWKDRATFLPSDPPRGARTALVLLCTPLEQTTEKFR